MIDDDDDALLARLRWAVAEADPVPGGVLAAADAAFDTRRLDARLAQLVADSSGADSSGADSAGEVPGDGLATVRGDQGDGRLLLYADGDLRVDVAVYQEGSARTLIGQVDGVLPGGLSLELVGRAEDPIDTDDLGRFLVEDVPPGLARLCCRTDGGLVLTEWVTL